MNKHPHEEVILAYYRGEQIEAWNGGLMEWRDVKRYSGGSTTAPTFHPQARYRIKPQPPKTYTVELTQPEIELLKSLIGAWPDGINVDANHLYHKPNAAERTE